MNPYEIKREARLDRMRARAAKLAREAEARISGARERGSHIPFGQPILVGHHSEKRHRRDIAKIEAGYSKGFALADESKALARRAERAEASTAVSSDDPEAVIKLREKLAKLEKFQADMKAGNAAVRRKASPEEIARVTGLSVANAAKLYEKDFAGRIGFPDYAITNNSAEIRRVKKRIAELSTKASAPVRASEGIGEARIVEEENRVRMIFPGKPDEKVRTALKRAGFKWSPTAGAWQRMASPQAWYAAREIATRALEDRPRPPSLRAPPVFPPAAVVAEVVREVAAAPRARKEPLRPAIERTVSLFEAPEYAPSLPAAEKPKKAKAQTDWLSVFGIKK